MRRRDDEKRIDPSAALVHHAVVANDHELRARANAARGRGPEPRESIARVFFPIAIGFENDRRGLRVLGEARRRRRRATTCPSASRARGNGRCAGRSRRDGRRAGAAPQARSSGASRAPVARDAGRGATRVEKCSISRSRSIAGIRDHRPPSREGGPRGSARRRERGERPVVAERADRLVARFDHERGHLQVVGLEAERRELALATDRPRRPSRRAACRSPSEPATPIGSAGPPHERCVREILHRDAAKTTRREEFLADGTLIEQPPAPVAAQGDTLARREGDGIGDVFLE